MRKLTIRLENSHCRTMLSKPSISRSCMQAAIHGWVRLNYIHQFEIVFVTIGSPWPSAEIHFGWQCSIVWSCLRFRAIQQNGEAGSRSGEFDNRRKRAVCRLFGCGAVKVHGDGSPLLSCQISTACLYYLDSFICVSSRIARSLRTDPSPRTDRTSFGF